MLALSSQLAQTRPTNTAAATAFTATLDTEITKIVVCNVTGTDARFSIYHDNDGTTYDDTTKLYHENLVEGQNTVVLEFFAAGAGISMAGAGTLGVQTDTASAINFTVYGVSTKFTGQGL